LHKPTGAILRQLPSNGFMCSSQDAPASRFPQGDYVNLARRDDGLFYILPLQHQHRPSPVFAALRRFSPRFAAVRRGSPLMEQPIQSKLRGKIHSWAWSWGSVGRSRDYRNLIRGDSTVTVNTVFMPRLVPIEAIRHEQPFSAVSYPCSERRYQ